MCYLGWSIRRKWISQSCPVDNIITPPNVHSHKVSSALWLANVSPSQRLQTMSSHITSHEFDELRNWLAPQLWVRLVNLRFDFLGYEEAMVQLLISLCICSDRYEVIFQCWSCSYQSEKKLNSIYVLTFKENCHCDYWNHVFRTVLKNDHILLTNKQKQNWSHDVYIITSELNNETCFLDHNKTQFPWSCQNAVWH